MYHRLGGGYVNLWSTPLLGAALADARRRSGMTQTALADAAGLSPRTVRRAETDGRVNSAHLVEIVNALNLRLTIEPPPPTDEIQKILYPDGARTIDP